MTYAQFLFIFLVIPLAVLGITLRRWWQRRHTIACAIVCLLAFLYTAPWDNHAAKVGLWSFDPQFAPPSHFLLYLPWEEYAFYALQGVFICALVLALSRRLKPRDGGEL